MFGLGWPELLLIFVAVLLLFGAKRLPEIASGLGKGIREFKKSVKETTDELKGSLDEAPKSPPAPRVDPPPSTDSNKKPE
ncbi:MAG: twin-arginine translocase TatA/TatE family subunit [candidate division Zixibacteria bacterium]|nr:twin-arginine translocase TatA/TatE family subunit [candidate division Zixibacteria bacterium]MDH3937701.1 twin-arginine translocase TatA/TatE family subunit [candidate division Zixibacteria bacterium]MDH4034469.1 twin-arginine translocase TatA/TatE family subunit [candidate division Zixibacteria bacterium]